MHQTITCTVCGGTSFADRQVLWPDLVNAWQLTPAEVAYIDRQQGTHCTDCGANLRSIALCNAVRAFLGTDLTLNALIQSASARHLEILEVNEAGSLTTTLRQFPGHQLASYPEVDMHTLPYADASFDLVLHSDTLEHVRQPVHALGECLRVLRPEGALCFTVPIVVGRMSRGRAGLSNTYHGGPQASPDDFMVHTEYGADAWTQVIEAGFQRVELHTVAYPAAIAMLARKRAP